MAAGDNDEVPMRFALRIPGDGRFTQRRLGRKGGLGIASYLLVIECSYVAIQNGPQS
jgi:hypothetical protein